MQLRGIAPEKIEKRLKMLLYGSAGVGKTRASIEFPKPYVIDTERGAENDEYIDIIKSKGGVLFQTTDFEELLQEVKALLTLKHDYKTLIIDPLTTIYNDLVDRAAIKVGSEFARDYKDANKYMKRLFNFLLKLDMNVIITSHAKNEYGKNLSIIGQTYDCYKKLDYLFDLCLEIQKQDKKRIMTVRKTRIKSFPEGESFIFSYDEIATRYGKEILEKDSKEYRIATDKQIDELKKLIEKLNVPQEITSKWLKKADADDFEEMSSEHMQKCIDLLKSKLELATTHYDI